jgi:flagellar hook-associated protein FlgK
MERYLLIALKLYHKLLDFFLKENNMDIQTSSMGSLNHIQQSMQKNASNIASLTLASKDVLEGGVNGEKELIEMKQSEQNFSSVAKVIKAEDDIMGTLLDIKV